MISTRFEAIGVYLPTTTQTTQELIDQLAQPAPFDYEAVTGVRERRVRCTAPEDYEDSFSLALKAIRDCLARSRYDATELDVIISVSITRSKEGSKNYFEPSFASMLAKELGATHAIHFDVSNACAGMITGVYILDRMIRSGIVGNGMVVSGEAVTPIAETAVAEIGSGYDTQFASLSVGDSACAIVLDRSQGEGDRIHDVELLTAAEHADACIAMPSDKTCGLALYTDNRRMHNESRFLLWTDMQRNYLAKRGRTFVGEAFDYIIHHQVGGAAITAGNALGEREFGTPMPASPQVLEKYGNTATTSHFIVLHDQLEQGHIPEGSKILLIAAASGLITGFLSATISSLKV